MYLRKRRGYWLEVYYKDGRDLSAMWHIDYSSIMSLANHNLQLGHIVKVTNCETEKQELIRRSNNG